MQVQTIRQNKFSSHFNHKYVMPWTVNVLFAIKKNPHTLDCHGKNGGGRVTAGNHGFMWKAFGEMDVSLMLLLPPPPPSSPFSPPSPSSSASGSRASSGPCASAAPRLMNRPNNYCTCLACADNLANKGRVCCRRIGFHLGGLAAI